MSFRLLAIKFAEPVPAGGNKYALAILNPDSQFHGLSQTRIPDHSYPTIDAVTKFIATHCQPDEVNILELERELGEGQIHGMIVSKDSAVKMGFKV